MIFIDSLYELGYSSINLGLVFGIIAFLGFVSLRSWTKARWLGILFLVALCAVFIWTTIYFAQISSAMKQERDQKRAIESNQTQKQSGQSD